MSKIRALTLMVFLGMSSGVCVGMNEKKVKPTFLNNIENNTKRVIERLVKKCQDRKKEIDVLTEKIRNLENASKKSNEEFAEQRVQWEQTLNQKTETYNNNLGLKDKLIKELGEKVNALEMDLSEAYRVMGGVNGIISGVTEDI